jgi:small redox-active disulfide protein 2
VIKTMKIELLGTGCAKCKSLAKNVEKAVAESGVEAEVVKVESLQEIMNRGVMMTPALFGGGDKGALEEVKGWGGV